MPCIQCSAVHCSAVRCGAVRCSAVQCSAVQCSAIHAYSAEVWKRNTRLHVFTSVRVRSCVSLQFLGKARFLFLLSVVTPYAATVTSPLFSVLRTQCSAVHLALQESWLTDLNFLKGFSEDVVEAAANPLEGRGEHIAKFGGFTFSFTEHGVRRYVRSIGRADGVVCRSLFGSFGCSSSFTPTGVVGGLSGASSCVPRGFGGGGRGDARSVAGDSSWSEVLGKVVVSARRPADLGEKCSAWTFDGEKHPATSAVSQTFAISEKVRASPPVGRLDGLYGGAAITSGCDDGTELQSGMAN